MASIGVYEQAERFCKLLDLARNRVGIINEILGCCYHEAPENPCRLTYAFGKYCLTFYGRRYVKFGFGELEGVTRALCMLDGLDLGVWELRRAGRLVSGDC